MSEINFFKNMNMADLVNLSENGEAVNGGKSTIQIISECNEYSDIPKQYANARFVDYEDVICNDRNITQELKSFCLDKNTSQIYGLSGTIGTGKTFLACASMHERAIRGLSAGLFLSCRTLKPQIMSSRSFKATISEWDFYQKYAKAPYLVLDEVGKCTDSQLEWEFLNIIFAMRYENMLPTVFTTNMDYGSLKTFILGQNNIGIDVYDRIKPDLIQGVLVGKSHRGANV